MTSANRLSQGEVIAGRYLSESGITFGDGTTQDTSAASGLGALTRYTADFSATGLTFTGTGTTHPGYNSYYSKVGPQVIFDIKILMTTVTNFGTGQFKTSLPFTPIASSANHFSGWVWADPSQPADDLNGHIQMVADHLTSSKVLDMHWLVATTSAPKPVIETLLSQGNPTTFTTASIMYINGAYLTNE
jgi:hypothetical protein